MQPLTSKTEAATQRGISPIEAVSNTGVALGGHVHANLVGATGLEVDLAQ